MEARALTPTFYQWIYGLYPDIPKTINKDYAKKHQLDAKIAPVQGFGIDRFVAEAKKKKSTWDVYVGMTPFVEMGAADRRRARSSRGTSTSRSRCSPT